MSRPDVIAVRTEVVAELLVDDLFEAAKRGLAEPLADAGEGLLARADEVLARPALDTGLPTRLARFGHSTRMAERARFDRAREPCPWLEDKLRAARKADGDPDAALAIACLELARCEPLERPRPDDPDAATWRIPGPGGHVRHLLALRALEHESAQDPGLKRAWVFGLVLASAETSGH